MLTWLPRPVAAAVGAAVLLTAAAALAQLPSAEQGAYNAVDDAVSAFRSASGRDEMTRAAGRILDAAERALNAFNAADSARDDAAARVFAAVEQAIAVDSGGRTLRPARLYCGSDRARGSLPRTSSAPTAATGSLLGR